LLLHLKPIATFILGEKIWLRYTDNPPVFSEMIAQYFNAKNGCTKPFKLGTEGIDGGIGVGLAWRESVSEEA
jgi:hypothetical protein